MLKLAGKVRKYQALATKNAWLRAERWFAFMSANLTWKNRENLSTFIQIVLSLPKILLQKGQLTPGRFNFRAKRLHYTNFRVFRQCLPRDVFILTSHYLKSVNYIDCRWWALYLPLSPTQGQLMKSERDNLRKKLFRLTVFVTLRWAPCATPVLRQKVVLLTSQCWILRFCDVMPTSMLQRLYKKYLIAVSSQLPD